MMTHGWLNKSGRSIPRKSKRYYGQCKKKGGKVGDIKKWNGRVKWAAYLDCSKSRKDLEDRFNSSCTDSR